MHSALDKYFWDGKEGLSGEFKLRRIIEYASFPDLIKYPFDEVKKYINRINPDKLWTGEERKRFIRLIMPYVEKSDSWEEAVFTMIDGSGKDAV
jgi:hypothetical protein